MRRGLLQQHGPDITSSYDVEEYPSMTGESGH